MGGGVAGLSQPGPGSWGAAWGGFPHPALPCPAQLEHGAPRPRPPHSPARRSPGAGASRLRRQDGAAGECRPAGPAGREDEQRGGRRPARGREGGRDSLHTPLLPHRDDRPCWARRRDLHRRPIAARRGRRRPMAASAGGEGRGRRRRLLKPGSEFG